MRDMRALVHRLAEDGLTVLLSSHLMDEVEDLCDRVAIVTRGRVVYEGALDELIAGTAGRYDLRTTDDGPAAVIARRAPGINDVTASARGLSLAGDERAVAALTLELAQAGIGLRALVPRTATLEELFFRMTEGTARMSAARRRARRRPSPHDRRRRAAHAVAPPRRPAPSTSGSCASSPPRSAPTSGFGCALLVPLIFIASLLADDGGPEGIPFGDYVRESGLAIPLVGLFFGAFWFFPLITALVAGDIVATEDGNGTLKTILTRSVDRWQIFVGKVLAAFTYAFAALVLFVGVGLVLGGLIWGFDPLISLSGNVISLDRSLLLIGGATLAYFLPTMAVASLAILLSTVTRNSAAAVVATLMLSLIMQLLGIVSALDFLRPYLLPTQFNAWQGLLREPIDWAPVVRAAWVSALFAIPALAGRSRTSCAATLPVGEIHRQASALDSGPCHSPRPHLLRAHAACPRSWARSSSSSRAALGLCALGTLPRARPVASAPRASARSPASAC